MTTDTGFRGLLRSYVETFPPLKIALYINDLICYLVSRIINLFVYIVSQSIKFIYYFARELYQQVYLFTRKLCSALSRCAKRIPWLRDWLEKRRYEQLKRQKSILPQAHEPVPYASNLAKRILTYHGGIALALALYIFVYFVLVKHHTYTTVSIAFILMLIYLVLIENSHNLRSIIMLCLPIMFTNRGRALVFCSMLAMLANGPIKTIQHNVQELHSSLTCCKQYLIVKSDEHIEGNYVQRLVRVEQIVRDLVGNIKQYARELKNQFEVIIRLAIATEKYIIDAINKLKEIVDVCNRHTDEVFVSCVKKINNLYVQCMTLFNPFKFNLCSAFNSVENICYPIKLPDVICRLPTQVIDFVERTIGVKLKQYILVLENEFYVDIDIDRKYYYNMTQSKSYKRVASEIKFDVERKFWYIQFIYRAFNFVSLILVIFILSTATVYHMHYLSDRAYDNMYLDESLLEIDEHRKRAHRRHNRASRSGNELDRVSPVGEQTLQISESPVDQENGPLEEDENTNGPIRHTDTQSLAEFDPLNEIGPDDDDLTTAQDREDRDDPLDVVSIDQGTDEDEQNRRELDESTGSNSQQEIQEAVTESETRGESLFPLSKAHERQYLKPFSLHMNNFERSKIKWSGLIWLIIVGYITFFLGLDFSLYELIRFLVQTLRDIMFTSDLPLVDFQTKKSGLDGVNQTITRYNRTYLNSMRNQMNIEKLKLSTMPPTHNESIPVAKNSSIQAFYRRLMDSIERDIPDDVAILDSLEQCLPKPQIPLFAVYRRLLYLALLTFGGVIVEAYALRTRHYIANLYYPRQAKHRAVWLYRKMLAEKPQYTDEKDEIIAQENLIESEPKQQAMDALSRMLADRVRR